MFKKLKDKIAEEVKSSPHRIQQLTQTVTEKIQNATSDESFFSIGEEDDSSTPEPGFSNVSLSNLSSPQSGHVRKNSNSSIASDISFLPRYESATNLYHLQSDLDISASEIEDNVSTSSQLGHLSKEQIHAAFQKAQMRYHKYRGRYADIKNYYKELEKENGKIKQVLVETQDKALRRVAELREQCSLEQKAKAHLENALRLELDEKQYVIDTLKTKVNLLQDKNSSAEKSEVLLSTDDELKTAQSEIETLNIRLQEMKANAIVFGSKEADLKKKIAELEEMDRKRSLELVEVVERERENNLIIAQTKMELHTEIQNRDLEIQNLKHDLEVLKVDLDSYENKNKSTKLENLHSQNAKLIEKIDSLTQKCNNYESELLKLEQFKIENKGLKVLQAKMREEVAYLQQQGEQQQVKFNDEIATYRENTKKNLLSLETKIRDKLQGEWDERERLLRSDFEEKLRQLTASSETTHEMQLKLLQTEDEAKALSNTVDELNERITTLNGKYDNLEKNHLELITENSGNLNELKETHKRLNELEMEVPKQKLLTEKISALEIEISNLHKENLKLSTETTDLQEMLATAESEVSRLRSVPVKEFEKLHGEFKRERSQLELQITALSTDAEVLQKEIVHVNELLLSPTDALHPDFKNDSVNKLTSSILSLQDQVRQLTDQKAALELELKQSKNDEELAKAKQAFQKKIKEQKAKFHADIQNLNAEVATFKEKNEQIQSYIEEYKQKLTEYEAASLQKTRQLEDFTKEVANLKDLLQKSDEVLSREKNALRQKNDEYLNLTNKLDELLNENTSLVSTQNKIIEEKEKLRQELDTVSHNANTLNLEIAQLKSSEEEHQKQISHLQDDHMIAMQQEIAKFKIYESNYNEEKNKNFELTNIIDELKREVENVKVDLNNTNEQYHADLKALKDERDKLQSDIDCNQQLREDLEILKQNEAALNAKLELSVQTSENYNRSLDEISELNCRNKELARDFQQLTQENDGLLQNLAEVKLQYENLLLEKASWENRLQEMERSDKDDNKTLQNELEEVKVQLRDFENQFTELSHERQLLQDEIQELKISPINVNSNMDDMEKLQQDHEKEINHLNDKLIQYKSLDLTNRTSIQFYENELQKLKNKNEKLNRKLDETLVTLNHCADLTTSTETEYLRNVLYNYMLGKEGMVLARVIAAVCKFDDNQTEAILQREQQKQTLLGQLGFR